MYAWAQLCAPGQMCSQYRQDAAGSLMPWEPAEQHVHGRHDQPAGADREQPDRAQLPAGHDQVDQDRRTGHPAQPGVVRPDHGPHRAETGHGMLLRFRQSEPAGQPLIHALAQVVLGLGQQPPSLPG
jgi:hypothetical protein